MYRVTGEVDIQRLLEEVKQCALAGALFADRIDLPDGTAQLVLMTQPVTRQTDLAEEFFKGTHRMDPVKAATMSPDPTRLAPFVKLALKDLSSHFNLTANKLTELLDLSGFSDKRDPPHIAGGLALGRAIRQAVNKLSDTPSAKSVKLVECFEHRFERLLNQRAVAANWECDAVTIRRYERDLALFIASELVKFQKIN